MLDQITIHLFWKSEEKISEDLLFLCSKKDDGICDLFYHINLSALSLRKSAFWSHSPSLSLPRTARLQAENHIFHICFICNTVQILQICFKCNMLPGMLPHLEYLIPKFLYVNSLYNPTKVVFWGQDISKAKHSDLFFSIHKIGILVPTSNGY